jgi:hypothetical protein
MPKDKIESTAVAKRGPKGASKPLTDKDFQKLLNMVRIQCTMEECCSVLEMSDTTLNRRLKEMDYNNFEDLYKRHSDEGRMSLRRMQWQNAEKGNSTMLVWLGKQYLNQKDKSEVQSTVEQRHVIDLTRISDEGLQSIEAAFSRIDPGASESGEVPQIIEGVHEG